MWKNARKGRRVGNGMKKRDVNAKIERSKGKRVERREEVRQ